MRRLNVWGVLCCCAMVAALALEPRADAQQNQVGTPPESNERARPRGRLPNYFSAVVTPEQRSTIYGIQAKFDEQIKQLRMQIEQLLSQRDRDVDGVLTQEQLAEVNKKREEATKRLQSGRTKKSS